jgi:alpha-L-fucosidase 2
MKPDNTHLLFVNKILGAALLSLALPASLSTAADLAASGSARQVLWYDQPAGNWESEALPIGNGRLGAMIFGAADKETIQINEDSLWEGDEKDSGMYQNLGEFEVALPRAKPVENYRRELDIGRALHTVTYTSDGVAFRREAFASFPDQVMVFRFTADKPGSHSGTLTLKDGHDAKPVIGSNNITAAGKLKNGLQYESRILVINDGGTLTTTPAGIAFQNVTGLTLVVAAGTDYLNQRAKGWRTGEAPHRRVTEQLDQASKRQYADLLAAHIKDYQSLFSRVRLDNGRTDAAIAALPTPKRMAAYKQANARDPELENLLFQYGRYLLIGSSRGALPANLQGLWNNSNNPPWRCDYHSNINIQMNYWLAETANLPECAEPLLNYIFSLRGVRTEQTSAEFKSKRGWTVQTENNIFGGSSWEWNTPGSAWYCQHLWEHYAFGGDKTYLRTIAYPVMKEVCEFWEDRLKALPDGTLVAPMGYSPEQGPREDGVSFDQELVWDLFTNYIEASQALDVDPEYRQKVIAMRDKLLVPKIGKWGQLQEWMVDRDDPKNDHRHVSHLFALHPGRQISPTKTPALAAAAKISLNARGDAGTGWSKAWKISFWARLLEGDHSYKMYSELLKNNIMANLFDTHPPFQMDGNFGATAGVCEMLLQSQAGELHLLPALPGAWPNGSVAGLRGRGGYQVDIEWKEGRVTSYRISSTERRQVTVRVNGETKVVRCEKNPS